MLFEQFWGMFISVAFFLVSTVYINTRIYCLTIKYVDIYTYEQGKPDISILI